MPKRPKPNEIVFKPEYAASAFAPGTEAQTVLAPWSTDERFFKLMLSWKRHRDTGNLSWVVSIDKATRQDLIHFIEEWVPKCPEPALLNVALEDLSAQVPEGVL